MQPLLLVSEYIKFETTESTLTHWANGNCAVAEQSTHHHKVEGLSPANAALVGRYNGSKNKEYINSFG